MKMTMHIDDALLERVMDAYGYESKTEAVEMSLREMDRRARLKEYMRNGLGLSPAELAEAVDPAYDVLAMRAAEPAGEYGKRRTRR